MKKHYKIEVDATPSENTNKPYFWVLKCQHEDSDNYCTVTAGWAETPEKAFEEAHRFYTKYKK